MSIQRGAAEFDHECNYEMYTKKVVSVVNTRMQPDEVVALDDLVKRGLYSSRTDAIRDAVNRLILAVHEADLVESHRRAYSDGADDDRVAVVASRREYRRMVETNE